MQQGLLKKTLLLMSILVGMAFVVQSSTTIHAQGLPDLVLEVSNDVGGRLVDDGSGSGRFNWVITLRNQGSADAVFENPFGLFDRSPNLFRFQTIRRGVSSGGNIIGNGGSGIIGGSIRCHPLIVGARCAYTAALTIEPGGFISLKIPALVFFSFLPVGSEIRPSECVADPQGLLDESDEDNTCTGLVTVVAKAEDTTPPVIAAHGDESEEATSASGAVVTYTAPDATDAVGNVFAATCLPASDSTFALGDTTVTCNASDAAGNAATATTFNVSVVDTTAPDTAITDAEDGDSNGLNDGDITLSTSVTFEFEGSDLVGIASFECQLDGGVFAPCSSGDTISGLAAGDHTFEVRSIDTSGNVDPSPASFDWTINTAPSCDDAKASNDTLWPPNHKFVDVNIDGVTDSDGDDITITIDSIFQDEPVNGTGDGDSSPDGKGVGTDTAEVRAERAGDGNGRVYHIGFTADDGNGGTCSGVVTAGVPHDKKDTPGDGGPLEDSTTP